jgi:GNAT superfamily N-acetyltransferase
MSTAGAVGARLATEADLPGMAQVLAEAFSEDPAFVYMLPPGLARRERRLHRFFRDELGRSCRAGGAWTTEDGASAAVWYPPGRWKPSAWEMVKAAPSAVRVFGRQLPLASAALRVLQEHHPTREHWYLYYLGTVAQRRSTGLGSALVRPVLDLCDEQGVPAYLEATSERNRDLYLRHGFVPSGTLDLPRGGPPVYPMWREPR